MEAHRDDATGEHVSDDASELDELIDWKDPDEGKLRRWPWILLSVLTFVVGYIVRGY